MPKMGNLKGRKTMNPNRHLFSVLLVILLLLTGCKGGATSSSVAENRLTVVNVQKAVDQLITPYKTGGQIVVLGIKEFQGGAQADLQFTDFTADFHNFSAYGTERARWSGLGTAEIARYTDGRIVLTKVVWNFGMNISGQISL